MRTAAGNGVVLDYGPESVPLLEAMIYSWWGDAGPSPEGLETTCLVLGAYLGEVMVRNLGGRWTHNEQFEAPGVTVDGTTWFPTAKVAKRFREPGHDLTQFYAVASTPPPRRRRFGR